MDQRLNSAVFLDRDGVINLERKDYVKSWEEFVWIDGALEALVRLAVSRFKIVVVTNQSAVGRGLLTLPGLDAIHKKMKAVIEERGGRIDGIYVCPHRPDENCLCRKPKPGLILQARDEMGIDLRSSYFVSDTESEIEMARALGMKTILIAGEEGAGVSNLKAAVELILGSDR